MMHVSCTLWQIPKMNMVENHLKHTTRIEYVHNVSIVHFCVTVSKVVNFIPLNHHLYIQYQFIITAYFRVYYENVKRIFLLYMNFDFKDPLFIQYVDINIWVLVLQLYFSNLFYDRAKICETLEVELKSIFPHSPFKSFFHCNI